MANLDVERSLGLLLLMVLDGGIFTSYP